MHLINHQAVVRRQVIVIPLPVKTVGVINYTIADRVGHLAGIGVDPVELFALIVNDVFILLPISRGWNKANWRIPSAEIPP